MKPFLCIALFSLLTPLLTFAQTAAAPTGGQQTAQGFIQNFVLFLNNIIVPFLLGIAFLIFVINVVRFFVFQSNNEDGQKAARALALYSILAFVIIIIFWGVVNVLTSSLGLRTGGAPTSDYIDKTQQPGTVPPPTQPTTAQQGNSSPSGNPSGSGNNASNNPSGLFTPPSNTTPPPNNTPPTNPNDNTNDPPSTLQGGPAQVDLQP